MSAKIKYSVEIFKDDDQYIAVCSELGVSSFGDSQKEAEIGLKEAVTLIIEECQRMGTLEEVLEEAGYHASGKDRTEWIPREPLVVEEDEVAVAGGGASKRLSRFIIQSSPRFSSMKGFG